MQTSERTQEPLLPVREASTPKQLNLFKGQVILNPTISRLNFYAFLLFSTYMGGIFIPVNLLFLPLLRIIYGLPSNEVINVATISQIVTILVKLFICSWLGYFCDKYGRRIFIILGVLFTCGSVAVMPNLPSVYPYYFLAQATLEVGLTCMMTPPLLADYIDYETKGRVAGLGAVISYVSASVSTFLAEKIDLQDDIAAKFHEFAMIGAGLGFVIILGLKGGAYHKALFYDKKAEEAKKDIPEILAVESEYEQDESFKESFQSEEVLSKVKIVPGDLRRNVSQDSTDPPSEDNEEVRQEPETDFVAVESNQLNLNDSFSSKRNKKVVKSRVAKKSVREHKPGFIAGLHQAKVNPWILTGYICSFLSFQHIMLANTSLVNYCTQEAGPEQGPNQAYALTNKHMIVAAFMSICFGFFADKYNKFKILTFILTCSILAPVLLLLSPSPFNFMAYLSMGLFGISCSGFVTFVSQVISKYSDPRYRASVGAVSSMASVLGMVVTNVLGIYLSKYNIAIPYYLYIGTAGIGFVVLFIIYLKNRNILNKL